MSKGCIIPGPWACRRAESYPDPEPVEGLNLIRTLSLSKGCIMSGPWACRRAASCLGPWACRRAVSCPDPELVEGLYLFRSLSLLKGWILSGPWACRREKFLQKCKDQFDRLTDRANAGVQSSVIPFLLLTSFLLQPLQLLTPGDLGEIFLKFWLWCPFHCLRFDDDIH